LSKNYYSLYCNNLNPTITDNRHLITYCYQSLIYSRKLCYLSVVSIVNLAANPLECCN